MKVLYFVRDDGGCAWYRLRLPMETCYVKKAMEVRYIEKGDPEDKIADYIAWSELIVCPRVIDERFLKAIQGFKDLGKKIVVDWDDNLFDISPLSPHYRDFGIENYSHEYMTDQGTQKLDIWIDGKNILLEKNKENLERGKEAMRMADMVTTTTPILAEMFRPFNSTVKVLPNCIDLDMWKALPFRPHKGIRFGWSGGWSHFEDWKILAGVLPEFMRMNPESTLVIMGQKFDGTLKGIDPKRIEYRGWCPFHAYPYASAILDLDFAVIPLVDSPFNNCKSAIKWVEMASLGIPSVTSFCSPYAEVMDLVTDNGIFVEENSPSGWLIGMNQLAQHAGERHIMGARARATVERHFDIEKKYPLWVDAYKEVLDGVAR